MNKRTLKESAEIVEKTIKEIINSDKLTKELITATCLKYGVSEKHIRRVACWEKEALV